MLPDVSYSHRRFGLTDRAAAFNTLTDLFLTVYPVIIVSFSSLSRKSRIGVISLLSLSLMFVPPVSSSSRSRPDLDSGMIAAIKRTLEAKTFMEYSDFTCTTIETAQILR